MAIAVHGKQLTQKPQEPFRMRLCQNAECSLRYPDLALSSKDADCPRCGGPTIFSGPSFGSGKRLSLAAGGIRVRALLDNIRSTYNVGSIFRTADGAGIDHLYLSGITPTPEHAKVNKTALGAEQSVPWSHHGNSLALAQSLRGQGFRLWALETGSGSESLFGEIGMPTAPVVLVVGNENAGIDPALLGACDRVLALPMLGRKGSLNVVVAFGIAAYFVRFGASKAIGWPNYKGTDD